MESYKPVKKRLLKALMQCDKLHINRISTAGVDLYGPTDQP